MLVVVLYDIIFETKNTFICSYLAGFGFHDEEIGFFGEFVEMAYILGVEVLDDGGTEVAA